MVGEPTFSQAHSEADHANGADNLKHANSKYKQAPSGAYRPDVPRVKENIRGSSTTAKLVAADPAGLQAAREDLATDFFAKTTLPAKGSKRGLAEELAALVGHEVL